MHAAAVPAMNLQISSETGALRAVIVHTPGREVSLVNPEVREELLFDDIIFEADARQEHLDMIEVLKTAVPDRAQVMEICDLALEAFGQHEAREFFAEELVGLMPGNTIRLLKERLSNLSAASLLEFVVTGTTADIPGISLNPLPNLLFTRDLAAVVNSEMILSRAAREARQREFLLMETVARFHPEMHIPEDRLIQTGPEDSIEGGDILVASEHVVLIGMSERTSFSGLMQIAEKLLSRSVRHVVAVDIPKKRSSMHLDTIFTFASEDECVVFHPAITQRTNNVCVLTRRDGRIVIDLKPALKPALEELLERDLRFISCGGEDLTRQYREQWTDGANLFALAPGIVMGYERNTATFGELERHGYRMMNQYEFTELFTRQPLPTDGSEKIAVTFQGRELCRGRGGARCMTLPVTRAHHPPETSHHDSTHTGTL